MGVSASTTSDQLPPSGTGRKLSGLGQILVPSSNGPTSLWNTEPRVILANNSDYIVSYWVVEEEKKRTKAQHERIATSIGLQLNANKITTGGGANLSEDDLKKLKQQEQETIAKEQEEDGEDVVYYLTRDHRMGRKGSTQPTKIPFPVDCRHVRLYGFFERDGVWRRYKDKVYSIALLNRNFRVTASTANIEPYVRFDHKNSPTRKTKKATKRR